MRSIIQKEISNPEVSDRSEISVKLTLLGKKSMARQESIKYRLGILLSEAFVGKCSGIPHGRGGRKGRTWTIG